MDFETNKKFCENCNAEVVDEALFCGNCGAKIEEKKKVKFCYNCGETIAEEAMFCVKCGTAVLKKQEQMIIEDVPVELEESSFVDKFRKISSSGLMLTLAILSVVLTVIKIVALDVLNAPMYALLAISCFVLWGKSKKGTDLTKTIKLFKVTSVLGIISEILLMIFIVVFVGIIISVVNSLPGVEEKLSILLVGILVVCTFIGLSISVALMIVLFKAIFKLLKNLKYSLENNDDVVSEKIMFPAILLFVIGGSSASSVLSTFVDIEGNYEVVYEMFPKEVVEILEYMIENVYMNQMGIAILAAIIVLFGILLIKLKTSLTK